MVIGRKAFASGVIDRWAGIRCVGMTETELQELARAFIERCYDAIHDPSEYTDKRKLRKRNKAQKEMHRIVKTVCAEPEPAGRFFSELLEHGDPTVRLVSAGYALAHRVCADRARTILEDFRNSEDPGVAFESSMALSVFELQTKGVHP